MDYTEMWNKMVIRQECAAEAQAAANKLLVYKDRYEKVAAIMKCPWYFIAVIHYRESSIRFDRVLHNGERIVGTNQKTKLVPKGRGPFKTWEDAAIDALTLRGIDKVEHWTIPVLLEELEQYNGMGYQKYHPDVPSPYLWSCTNYYLTGKYGADGKFDTELKDKQIGCAPILKYITDKTAELG